MRRLRGREQCCYQEGGGHDCEGGLLAREDDEEPLQHDDAPEVECNQRSCERAVDEGAVDEHVYVVEAVAQDGDAGGDGEARECYKQGRQSRPLPGQCAGDEDLPETRIVQTIPQAWRRRRTT